jgi:hypothetical protein
MEDLWQDHVPALLGLVMTTAPPLIALVYWIGRLSARVDRHDVRLDKLETEKVALAVCAAFHDGLHEELGEMHKDITAMRQMLFEMLKTQAT